MGQSIRKICSLLLALAIGSGSPTLAKSGDEVLLKLSKRSIPEGSIIQFRGFIVKAAKYSNFVVIDMNNLKKSGSPIPSPENCISLLLNDAQYANRPLKGWHTIKAMVRYLSLPDSPVIRAKFQGRSWNPYCLYDINERKPIPFLFVKHMSLSSRFRQKNR
jgi:hypothetical protein